MGKAEKESAGTSRLRCRATYRDHPHPSMPQHLPHRAGKGRHGGPGKPQCPRHGRENVPSQNGEREKSRHSCACHDHVVCADYLDYLLYLLLREGHRGRALHHLGVFLARWTIKFATPSQDSSPRRDVQGREYATTTFMTRGQNFVSAKSRVRLLLAQYTYSGAWSLKRNLIM